METALAANPDHAMSLPQISVIQGHDDHSAALGHPVSGGLQWALEFDDANA